MRIITRLFRVPSRRREGFSLVELLVVAFILGVGLLGLAALMALSLRGQTSSRRLETATFLANNVLEQLSMDGRISAQLRSDGQIIPATALVANAADGTAIAYSAKDIAGTLQTTFDLEGRPSATTQLFRVNWVRRANAKGGAPAPSSNTATSEVVVNVTWTEDQQKPGGGSLPIQKWLSISRMIRY